MFVEITLVDGTVHREMVKDVDSFGIVILATVVARDGGYGTDRIIPWASIRDVAVMSDDYIDIEDDRYRLVSLGNMPNLKGINSILPGVN